MGDDLGSPAKRNKKGKHNHAWQPTERSDDLDSLDSSYFRNSSHQLSGGDQDTTTTTKVSGTTEADHRHQNGNVSHLADTTTSNSDYSPDEAHTLRTSVEAPLANVLETESLSEIKYLDDILKLEDVNFTSENNTITSSKRESIYHSSAVSHSPVTQLSAEVTKLVIKLNDPPPPQSRTKPPTKRSSTDIYKTRDEIKSIVSYDSIYLSSEVVSEDEDGENHYSKPSEVYVSNVIDTNHSIAVDDYDEIINECDYLESKGHLVNNSTANSREHSDQQQDQGLEEESCLDTLYSQVNKSKPKIVGVETKSHGPRKSSSEQSLNEHSKHLDKLSVLSGSRVPSEDSSSRTKAHTRYKKNAKNQQSSSQSSVYRGERIVSTHHHQQQQLDTNHYYSLPDINIGKLLTDSEKIDEKLRLSSNTRVRSDQPLIYESAGHFGKQHKRIRQRENCELLLSEPNTVDELPREVPSIEVETPSKSFDDDYRCDFDRAPTSLDTFGSDQESVQPTLFTVSIGGKQVIVDEVDKLHFENLKNSKRLHESSGNSGVQRSNSLRDNTVLKESVANRNSEIKAFVATPNNTAGPPITAPPVIENTYEKEIKEYFEERIHNKVNEENQLKAAAPEPIVKQPKNNQKSAAMPRPQILNVQAPSKLQNADNEKGNHIVTQQEQIMPPKQHNQSEGSQQTETINLDQSPDDAQQEFHDKVDSIRCYWSKLATNIPATTDSVEATDRKTDDTKASTKTVANDVDRDNEDAPKTVAVDDMIKQLEKETKTDPKKLALNNVRNNLMRQLNKPTVEIVEFDDKTQTAVVKARSSENVFDHVRYKVVKTETFQKNLQSQKHKEAQFDGLMQYLQDYSFQVNRNTRSVQIP